MESVNGAPSPIRETGDARYVSGHPTEALRNHVVCVVVVVVFVQPP